LRNFTLEDTENTKAYRAKVIIYVSLSAYQLLTHWSLVSGVCVQTIPRFHSAAQA